jgi:Cdc6-like AAA superfamily ATPase
MARPRNPLFPEFEDMTFYEYFSLYHVEKQALKEPAICTDDKGGHVYKYKKPPLIQFKAYHPARCPEGFAYNVLLQVRKFRNEGQLLRPAAEKSYLRECILGGELECMEQVEGWINAYARYNLHELDLLQNNLDIFMENGGNDCMDLLSGVHEDIDTTLIPAALRGYHDERDLLDNEHNSDGEDESILPNPDPDIGISPMLLVSQNPALARTIVPAPMPSVPTIPVAETNNDILSSDQQLVADVLLDPACKGIHVITGGPGCGKTFLTQHLLRKFKDSRRNLIVCGSTGVSACRLSSDAMTLHRAFNIKVKGMLETITTSDECFERINQCDVVVVDEFSMITRASVFHVLWRLLQGAIDPITCRPYYTDIDDMLKHKLIVFIGDEKQLPPVCHCKGKKRPHDVCRECIIFADIHFREATFHTLTTNFRQASDPVYLKFLNYIRDNVPTQEMIDEVLGDCTIDNFDDANVLHYLDEETTIICSHLDRVLFYNNTMFHKCYPDTTKHLITGEASKQNSIPVCAVGCKVMITNNDYIKHGIANGTVGTIIASTSRKAQKVNRTYLNKITVSIEGTNHMQDIKKSGFYSTDNKDREVKFPDVFPLKMCYSLTVHKCQGMTICNKVLIDITDGFCPGLLYVALSRITNRSNIKIATKLTPDMFIPVVIPRF